MLTFKANLQNANYQGETPILIRKQHQRHVCKLINSHSCLKMHITMMNNHKLFLIYVYTLHP